MKKSFGIFVFIIIFPYLAAVFILGQNACRISREIPMEEYVPAVTASQISWDSPKEAIKAQTIIARTNLYLKWKEGAESEMLQSAAENIKNRKMNTQNLRKFQVFQEASQQTQGKILKWDGKVREVPYHVLSPGQTRDGKEVLGEDFSYISSVETPKDSNSPLYVKGCYFSFGELEKKIKKKYTGFTWKSGKNVDIRALDLAGCVLEIEIGGQIFQGEEIKELLGLPSSCFYVQTSEKEIRFLCKGIGHGMGMSQYTAGQMALEGKKYTEILEYFFPQMQIGMYNFSYSGNPIIENKKGAELFHYRQR